jgi:hypothetical protein
MKINQNANRLAARWYASTMELLTAAVDHLRRNRLDNSRWSSCGFDGRERSPEEPNTSIDFRPLHLSSMRHFRVSHKNEGSWQIQVSSGGEFSVDLLQSTMDRFRRLDLKVTKSADVTYLGERADDSAPDTIRTFLIEFGWRTQSGPPGHFIRASLLDGGAPPSIRYAFIDSAVTHLGLNDVLQIEGNEKEFSVSAAHGWSLYEFETWLNKTNPSSFRIGPFPSFDDVWQRAERLRADPLGKQINRLAVSFFVAPDVYETMYDELNELANDWGVGLYGSYANGIDPYRADASQSTDGRFPIFVWSPEQGEGDLFYQADIVPTPEGRFLEIHSNCGDMKKLLKEAEAATGVKFTPVSKLLPS